MKIDGSVEKLLLTMKEGGHMAAMSDKQLYKLCSRGEIECVRLGRSVRVPKTALLAWIAKNTVAAA